MNNDDTPTPRTDEAIQVYANEGQPHRVFIEYVKPDDMRTLERELAAAQAEIAQLRAAQEWRPIEEAPRDGTRFLAVTANGFYDVIYYSKRTQDFVGKWSPFVAWLSLPPPPKGPAKQCANCRFAMEIEDRYDHIRCCHEQSPNYDGHVEATDVCKLFSPPPPKGGES